MKTINTVPLYLPQPDFSVLVMPWPVDAPIPNIGTLIAVPADLAGKPISFDFNKNEWVSKTDEVIAENQAQLSSLTSILLS